MCGITGIFNYRSKSPVKRHVAEKMKNTIIHRGPDDEGSYFFDDAGLFLGFRRLSIIDLSTGHQPMCNEDGAVWIVFNGEIYNFPELRSELKSYGHIFKTNSDTETILHAYEQWGMEAFSRLNGMYGFALWDSNKRQLILARDPFGIKPLYYWTNDKSIAFGSELKSILHHPEVVREVDLQAIGDFLTLTYVPSPRTAFSGIKKLPPGFAVICSEKGFEIKRFYRKPPRLNNSYKETDLIEELRERIVQAIKRQMISDVPIGAMLSGGVDSSTLVNIMTELSDEPIKTFTVGFEGDYEFNELHVAREVANSIGSNHFEAILSSKDYENLLPHSIWHLEEPVATTSTLAFYLICKLARQHVTVVLTGQGADEPFAGYPRHLGERYGSVYRLIPSLLRKGLVTPLIERLPRNERLKRAVRSLGIKDPVQRMYHVYNTINHDLKEKLLRNSFQENGNNEILDSIKTWQEDVAQLDGLSQMLYIDSRFSLSDNLLMYGDKMSMAVSLEARVPFLDLELMSFVESIPPAFKIKGLTQKYLLKKAASKWISDDLIKRKKVGFAIPVDEWFQSEMRKSVEDKLLSQGSACRTFFNPEAIKKMLDDHQNKKEDHKRILFSLLTFEIWHELFIKPVVWNGV